MTYLDLVKTVLDKQSFDEDHMLIGILNKHIHFGRKMHKAMFK